MLLAAIVYEIWVAGFRIIINHHQHYLYIPSQCFHSVEKFHLQCSTETIYEQEVCTYRGIRVEFIYMARMQ